LLQFLRQRKELIEKSEVILDMATQIGSAMYYLEKNGFIHRDLVRKMRERKIESLLSCVCGCRLPGTA
jgi:serine/threonine protein kinase